ncbi:MAG: thioredoxin domain-containing protein [Pyrinomonadaceae bacterium]
MKNLKMILFAGLFLVGLSAVSASAQDSMMSDKMMMKSNPKNPTVAIIRADWCSACKEVEPIVNGLMQSYEGKLNLVVLDVSNDESTAKAAATAKSLGLTSFFEANKKSTSTVGVFKNKKQIFKTTHNPNRDVYVAAFEKATRS